MRLAVLLLPMLALAQNSVKSPDVRGREWHVGSDFVAEIYSDAPDAGTNPTHTMREEKKVTAATVLHVKMASGGGQAIRIRPAQ